MVWNPYVVLFDRENDNQSMDEGTLLLCSH